MKLRNKQTGEIGNLNAAWLLDTLTVETPQADMPNKIVHYNSLAELNTEWEDASEELKEHWAIDQFGEPINVTGLSRLQLEKLHQLGNDFETEEEVEKAVEKAKAIEKLKEYELHVEWANTPEYDEDEDRWYCSVDFSVREGCNGDILFNLLFGGEE